ncbi:MAG TPA: hypothetical protein VNT92_01520 [Acidimicrobiia bacterium]|nr:hypothetical protein [Acidimicrobiia bacterium]
MSPRSNPPPVPIRFDREEWLEEVERLDERSLARNQAERARREIEAGTATLNWQRCEAEGESGTSLPGCNKLYVPLGNQGASEAPFGFVFQLAQDPDGSLVWNFIAFGERHPNNPATRTVYERAHKRLHGRYP